MPTLANSVLLDASVVVKHFRDPTQIERFLDAVDLNRHWRRLSFAVWRKEPLRSGC